MRAIFLLAAFPFCFAGCVKRTIVVESDPPGASVWINEHPLGPAPATYEFITHGRYKFRLEKAGFREVVAREMVRAPIYQWIPVDFVAEYLVPFHFNDRHLFRYSLTPMSPEEHLQARTEVDLHEAVADLTSRDPRKRRLACVALARARDPSTADAVRAATRDPDPSVRAYALEALRAVDGLKAMDRLLEALRADPSPLVRWQAAVELEALHSKGAVPGLITALKDRDHLVRTGAAEGLKGIPDPSAVQPLIRALRDRDTAVRRASTEGLGLIGDRAAVPALCRVLFHHDVRTRRNAAQALARLKDPASGPALVRTFTDWDPKVRRAATAALIEFGDARVVPTLIRRLRALKPWTREHAARVLAGLKDPRAVEPLGRAFRREMDPPASAAMFDALVALGAGPDATWAETLSHRVKEGERQEEERKKRDLRRSGAQSPRR